MKKWILATCACLVLGLAAIGCGDDDDSGDSGDSAATTEQTAPAEKPAGSTKAKPTAVSVVDIDYEPSEVVVPKGGTIKWTNTGQLPHTVTKDGGPGPDFTSETLNPGDTYEETFDTAGEIDYVCKIHPQQTGKITVQ
jgi:plastocyanin